MSRVVDKRAIFGEDEKDCFVGQLRALEAFSGVEVVTFCVMSNHFHLLVNVPVRPEHLPEDEVWRRMGFIYSESRMNQFRRDIARLEAQNNKSDIEEFYDSFRRRMYDLSSFVKDLKQRFTMWYNVRNHRKGTLWEERFKSLLLERSEGTLLRVAAYIDLNPVRGGLVEDPSAYPWCGFYAAVNGDMRASAGISRVFQHGTSGQSANAIVSSYGWILNSKVVQRRGGKNAHCRSKNSGNEEEQSITSDDQSFREALGNEIRHMSSGLALGSRSFIQDFSRALKMRFDFSDCDTGEYPVPGEAFRGIYTAVRVRPER
jgi:REP element-mobilizing transposase RayT